MSPRWVLYMNAVNRKMTDAWKRYGYSEWIGQQWQAWKEDNGKKSPLDAINEEFDAWLEEKWGRI